MREKGGMGLRSMFEKGILWTYILFLFTTFPSSPPFSFFLDHIPEGRLSSQNEPFENVPSAEWKFSNLLFDVRGLSLGRNARERERSDAGLLNSSKVT